MRLTTRPSLFITTVWRYASSADHGATSGLTFRASGLAAAVVTVTPAVCASSTRGAPAFSVVAALTSPGTPRAQTHASLPYFDHCEYGSVANPFEPHSSPH